MSEDLKQEVYWMIDRELATANRRFPPFSSNHEAFALILEKTEQAREDMASLDVVVSNFWEGVKEQHEPEAIHEELTAVYRMAYDLAVSAIQAAALARKGIMSNVDLRGIDRNMTEEERRGEA